MSAAVERVTETRFGECVAFLREREWRCVTLASHFAANGCPRYGAETLADAFVVVSEGEAGIGAGAAAERVTGVVALTRTGILLHCLDRPGDPAALRESLTRSVDLKSVRCVLGPSDGTRFLEGATGRTPYRSVAYTLMVSETEPEERQPPDPGNATGDDRLAFVRCAPDDAVALLSLQEGYEREEVVPPGDPFDRKACRIMLERSLAKQAIYAARAGGRFVSKAGTNARGFGWDQLGGVYTDPAWRGRGLAKALVAHVVRERRRKGRKVVLFVKDGNDTARGVYEATGFRRDSPFRISYF